MENESRIKQVLVARGYGAQDAGLVAHELMSLSPQLQPLLDSWILNESHTGNYQVHGYSIAELMHKRRMTYPAALLTIDWLIKVPEKATQSLTRGTR